jgi:hypothetical protein
MLLCQVRNVKIAAEKRCTIQQHKSRDKHINGYNEENKLKNKKKYVTKFYCLGYIRSHKQVRIIFIFNSFLSYK